GFERRDAAADGRVIEPQPLRGGDELPRAGDREKHPDVVPVHETRDLGPIHDERLRDGPLVTTTRQCPIWKSPQSGRPDGHSDAILALLAGRPSRLLGCGQDEHGRRAMAQVTTDDGVKLYYEETGDGTPIVFVHEFAGTSTATSRSCAFSRGA